MYHRKGDHMKETDEERRHRLYGSNGKCYGSPVYDEKGPVVDYVICGGIDTCPETARQEGIGTALAVIMLSIIFLGLLEILIFLFTGIVGLLMGV